MVDIDPETREHGRQYQLLDRKEWARAKRDRRSRLGISGSTEEVHGQSSWRENSKVDIFVQQGLPKTDDEASDTRKPD
jgi:hypothetical protein